MTPAERYVLLSAREREVVKLLLGGSTNRQISDSLGIAPTTVAKHRENIYDKLGLKRNKQHDNPHLRLWANGAGLVVEDAQPGS